MARMIPPTYHGDTLSRGEIEIFFRLRDDPATKEWIVLHSLDIANHQKQVSGEIDFVVIIPQKGVLCIEVKACHTLKRQNGLWFYGKNATPDSRGPFKQASNAMHSMRSKLTTQHQSLRNVPFWSAVIFPYVPFTTKSDEWHAWQVIDANNFKSRPISVLLEQILNNARAFIQSKMNSSWEPGPGEPTVSQCKLIADLLRPSFEFYESAKSRKRRQNEELKYYTTEQLQALDTMETNPRVIFSGPAGTGKTLLALETARRSSDAGRKVLFLCYNRLLGKWIKEQLTELEASITSNTLHGQMRAVAGYPKYKSTSTFWQEELPNMAIDTLLETEGDENQFDELIIDEAQDLLRDNYLDFLDLSLRGGLASGRWRFFGDFEKQAIYNAANLPLENFQRERAQQPPVYSLRANCRNTPRIAELVHLLGGLSPRYSRILRPDDYVQPNLRYYVSNTNQQQLLINTLQQLYSEGITGDDIVILSPKSSTACVASKIHSQPWKDRLKPIDSASRGQIGYCSIQAFKGLEAAAIVVTDIDTFDSESSISLFYIAVTRALHKLFILMDESVKRDIAKLLSIRL